MKNSWRTRLFTLVFVGIAALAQAAPNISPLTFGVAIERGDLPQARQWLDQGLDPNFVGDRVGTGLMIAAWEGNVPMMELFAQRGGRIDFINKNGEQALQLAAFKGHMQVVKWLLEHGAAVNREGNQWSALHYAVFNGHRELAQYLISRGADVNARVPNEATSLMLAAREGHEDITKDLIQAGADPRLSNDRGETALNWAMLHGNVSIAKLVSSPEAFANVARNQPVNRPVPMRSIAAPTQIEDLLKRIRYAEEQNLPTAGLRKALMTAVERARMESKRAELEAKRKDAGAVKAIVITAQRQGGGEKVELITAGASKPAALTQTPSVQPPVVSALPPAPVAQTTATSEDQRIQLLLARIRIAKQNGQPTDQLRKELMDAVAGFKP